MQLRPGDRLPASLVVGVLFLIIQFVALVFGLALARSITGRCTSCSSAPSASSRATSPTGSTVKARDQLGELADSFNRMTASIEHLLAEMAEKKRLEEELRIARDIQMSLLPQGPLRMPGCHDRALLRRRARWAGTTTTSSPLDDERIGVLIADVSGKGTSAALYMAELKGLMLSLTQIHTVAARAADCREPDHRRTSRQPQLHHDDLRDHRSRDAAR